MEKNHTRINKTTFFFLRQKRWPALQSEGIHRFQKKKRWSHHRHLHNSMQKKQQLTKENKLDQPQNSIELHI